MSGAAKKTDAAVVARVPRTRGLLWAGIVLLVVVGLHGIAVAADPAAPWTQGLDDAWRRMIGVGPDSGAYTWFLPMFFQHLGQLPGMGVLMLILPIVLAAVGRWRTALFVLAVQLAGPGLVSQALKNTVNRPRPATDQAMGLYGPLFPVDHGSFPSGHAVSAGALAVILLALVPLARRGSRVAMIVIGAVLIVGMIWQRTLINAHWFSDCITGAAAGIGVALVLWWAFQPWLTRDLHRRPWFLGHRGAADAPPRTASRSAGA
ncbi:phosphatase PAP2 family protein [Microbacterium sp.]|uniref:phosphatase PAP2 family protein n=1 Tax=Microbacterium sp. TaxID=51671 RepID=UPI003C713D2D